MDEKKKNLVTSSNICDEYKKYKKRVKILIFVNWFMVFLLLASFIGAIIDSNMNEDTYETSSFGWAMCAFICTSVFYFSIIFLIGLFRGHIIPPPSFVSGSDERATLYYTKTIGKELEFKKHFEIITKYNPSNYIDSAEPLDEYNTKAT